jgi:AmmeMemoRadiSam system protein B
MAAASLHASIRPSLVDGLFYPAEKQQCAALIDELLAAAPVAPGTALGVVTPHAAYEYAGGIMAAAYRSLSLRPVRTAVLIGPVHRDPTDALYLPESEAFSTPLGEVPVDAAGVRSLLTSSPLFRCSDIPHLEEHCLELQVPFLARLFPGVSIVPVLTGNARAATAAALTRALSLTFPGAGGYTVYIATANMASYLGGRNGDAESALMEDLLARCDTRGMLAAVERRELSACGVAGIAALIELGGAGCSAKIVARGSSRDREEEKGKVVHYAAAAILAPARLQA